MPALAQSALYFWRNCRTASQIVGLHALGVHRHSAILLHVLKLDQAFEREMHLGLVEDMEQDDVVAAMPQLIEALQDRLGIGQQVAEEHDQAAVRIMPASWCRHWATSVCPAGLRFASIARMLPSCVRLLLGGRHRSESS